jgi:chromosome segregation ATPase
MFSSVAIAQFHAAKTGHQDFSESTEARPELTAEEKTARLAELRERLEEKRKLDKLKGDEERREAELLRRKSGHNAAMARREMQEKEMVKAAEQLRKDREEEKQIRARIRAEMEEEKRLRKAAINAEATKPKEPETPEEPLKLVSQDSDSIRIQVKLAGGDNIKAVFKSSDKLAVLLDKLSEKTALTPTNKLMVPFPRTYIDVEADAEKTFMELGLCPSASLVLE